MVERVPTVEIVNPKDSAGSVIINRADYDPAVHTLWADRSQRPPTAPAQPPLERASGGPMTAPKKR